MISIFEKYMVDGAHSAYPLKKPIEDCKNLDEMREGENKTNFYRSIAFRRGFLYCVEILSEQYGIDVYKIVADHDTVLQYLTNNQRYGQ